MSESVAIIGHAAELGGAELSLIRSLDTLPHDHRPIRFLWLSDGPVVDALRGLGLPVDVIALDPRALSTDRFAAAAGRGLRLSASGSRTALAVASWLRRHDIGLVMTTSMKSLVVGTVAARLARRPLVWWIHDRVSADYLPTRLVRALRLGARTLPEAVIVNSWDTARTVPGVRHLAVAHPGFAPDRARPEPRPRPAGPPVVGIVGRISPTKGQLEFVRAAAIVRRAHPEARFRIIGAPLFGAQPYLDRVVEEIARLGIEDGVELVGFVADTTVELDAMTVCVHASPVPEPFGNVVVEAMVRGVPVIATDAGGVPEIIRPDDEDPLGLLVPPGDVAALAEAITAVLDDPDRAQERAARAHRSAVARFPASGMLAVVLQVWDDVLGPRPSRIPPAPVAWPAETAYRPPSAVAWLIGTARADETVPPVHLARLPDGPINLLEGSASVIWQAATTAPESAWLDSVATGLGASVEDIRPHAEEFVADLVRVGLLEDNRPPIG